MNWKEEFLQLEASKYGGVRVSEQTAFISTLIEKIIEEIPNWNDWDVPSGEIIDVKQQLRDKYLSTKAKDYMERK